MRFAAGVAKLSTRHKINEERERDRKGKSLGKSHAYWKIKTRKSRLGEKDSSSFLDQGWLQRSLSLGKTSVPIISRNIKISNQGNRPKTPVSLSLKHADSGRTGFFRSL